MTERPTRSRIFSTGGEACFSVTEAGARSQSRNPSVADAAFKELL